MKADLQNWFVNIECHLFVITSVYFGFCWYWCPSFWFISIDSYCWPGFLPVLDKSVRWALLCLLALSVACLLYILSFSPPLAPIAFGLSFLRWFGFLHSFYLSLLGLHLTMLLWSAQFIFLNVWIIISSKLIVGIQREQMGMLLIPETFLRGPWACSCCEFLERVVRFI